MGDCPTGRGCRRLRRRALGRVKHHASPLWTLQRPRFEPDVATGLSDRGENREPGAATEAIRMQLTTEMRLENGPRLRRISSSASAKWSGAADRQAAILNAQGSAEAIRLEGEARANVLRLNVEVLRTNALVVELVRADRWNGILPQTLLDGTGVIPVLGLPRQDNAGGEMTPGRNDSTMAARPI